LWNREVAPATAYPRWHLYLHEVFTVRHSVRIDPVMLPCSHLAHVEQCMSSLQYYFLCQRLDGKFNG